MRLLNTPSPNWNARPAGGEVDTVLLHATASADTGADAAWCRRPKSTTHSNPVSYHAIVDRDGTVYSLVHTDKRAWHAGGSEFLGRTNVNDFSIGLSFANRNDGIERYPDVQLAVGAALVAGYMRWYRGIRIERVTTHAIVRAAWRLQHPDAEIKTDPQGPAFDLATFQARIMAELAAHA